VISGTPTETGIFSVILTATNGTGSGTRTLALTITPPPPPNIISSPIANGVVGRPFTYQTVATGNPIDYAATGLPGGLNVNINTGLISGTPGETGVFNVTLTATNTFGSSNKTLKLTIALPPAPVVTSVSTAAAVLTDPFTYQIIAVNNPTIYAAQNLPPGLSVNSATGLISGAPTASGTFRVIIRARNAGGSGAKILNLTVASSGPLANFAWSTVQNPQQMGVPFAPVLTARDAKGRTVLSLNGDVTVAGEGPGLSAAILLITECGTSTVDYFEIQNVGNATATTAGWFVIPNNAGGTGGGINARNAIWQLPATIGPGPDYYHQRK
jgi:hypothetical protein